MNAREFHRIFIGFIVLLSCWISITSVSMATASTTPIFSDNFNNNDIDSSNWDIYYIGNSSTVDEEDEKLEIVIAANSSSKLTMAGITSLCQLRGDFDMQVDYELLMWPSSNGVRVGLTTPYEGSTNGSSSVITYNTERASFGPKTDAPGLPREVYATNFNNELTYTTQGTSDMSGKLRMVRSDSTIAGYYYRSGEWIPIDFTFASPVDVDIRLIAWTTNSTFTNRQVNLAFDNFILNEGNLVNC